MNRFLTLVTLMLFLLLAACVPAQNSPPQSAPSAADAPLNEESTPATDVAVVEPDAPTASIEPAELVAEPVVEVVEEVVEATAADQPIAEAEPAVASVAEPAQPAEPVAQETNWLAVTGRTTEGLATLGNPDAAVTMIDYSDFM